MADYQRFVSYIYSYPGGVRDKNIGFAKVEIRAGEMHLDIKLRGVYTDTPKMFGVHMLVDRDKEVPGRYRLIKAGDCIVNNGISSYKGIFNAGNIDNTGYAATDICGIAIANKDDSYYRMFSMWEDYDINPAVVEFVEDKAAGRKSVSDKEGIGENAPDKAGSSENASVKAGGSKNALNKESIRKNTLNKAGGSENALDKEVSRGNTLDKAVGRNNGEKEEIRAMEEDVAAENVISGCYETGGVRTAGVPQCKNMSQETDSAEKRKKCCKERQYVECDDKDKLYKKLYCKADYIDAFDDDYFYDCIEVTPQMLSKLPIRDKEIINNSFLIHGYYNFHHLLFGRVCDNENNTNYFIGVPGMYCNREHYMAAMFGFNNFKKSHRSDYTNPYFGYWYQEI